MTPRQQQMMSFINAYWAEHGRGPTMTTISAALGYGHPMGCTNMITRLQAKGLLYRQQGVPGLRPTGRCPCCGRAST